MWRKFVQLKNAVWHAVGPAPGRLGRLVTKKPVFRKEVLRKAPSTESIYTVKLPLF